MSIERDDGLVIAINNLKVIGNFISTIHDLIQGNKQGLFSAEQNESVD